jgi:hypothetical protein
LDHDTVTGGIPFDPSEGDCVKVAAHAVVESRAEGDFDLDDFADSLPTCADISGLHPAADLMAYFDITVETTSLYGDYYGWCIDTDREISAPFSYPADVWSSYATLPVGLIEYEENLDLVNWILNHQFVNLESPGCDGSYTYGDEQRAIWHLLDDGPIPDDGGTDPFLECRVLEIQAMAWAEGEGYEPDCGDVVGVILVPVDECGGPWDYQFVIIPVPAECDVTYGDETAWAKAGDGYDCGWKTGWGSYMEFCFDTETRLP